MGEARRESYRAISLGANDPLSRAAFRRVMASDIERSSVSEDQTEVNIRERGVGRKQKPLSEVQNCVLRAFTD